MALIKCIECGKEHSDTAVTCPNCGYSKAVIEKARREEGLCEVNLRKNKYIAGVFTFFFWWIGGQYIYLGLKDNATWYALIATFFIALSMVVPFFWILLFIPFIQAILFCTQAPEVFDAKYNQKDSPRISGGRAFLVILGILIRCVIINAMALGVLLGGLSVINVLLTS
ncbi:DNA-directed RNA polymerase subunit RPC12/RpoP [Elusimicrobium posterum]|uniref:zinc-ribbon domain-containing protein n=1 Tax=Elusimicrobium posterum TaxID=3116653 RepID=UPI003C779457